MQGLVERDSQLRSLLAEELERRLKRNPRYSLRSLAQTLGVSHTLLSLVLNRKRAISSGLEKRLLDKLDLSTTRLVPTQYQKISLDTFTLLSEWHHFAILSLLETPKAVWNARWIGRRLGISELQAKLAMARLKRLGMVHRKTCRYKQTGKPLIVENQQSTPATRRFQRQILEKATEALENGDLETRELLCTTFAVDPKWMGYARTRIRQLSRSLVKDLEDKGPGTEVYNLSIQLCPATILEGKHK